MRFTRPSTLCHECDGDGVVGAGGPGNYPCSDCRRTGRIPRRTFDVEAVLAALESNTGYTPSGNHVIREIAKSLGLEETQQKGLDVRPCPNSGEPCVEYCTREPGGCMHGVPDPGQQKVQ